MKWFLVFSTEEGCPPLTVPIIAEGGCRKKFKLFATGYFFCYLIYFFCNCFTFLAPGRLVRGKIFPFSAKKGNGAGRTRTRQGKKRKGAFPVLRTCGRHPAERTARRGKAPHGSRKPHPCPAQVRDRAKKAAFRPLPRAVRGGMDSRRAALPAGTRQAYGGRRRCCGAGRRHKSSFFAKFRKKAQVLCPLNFSRRPAAAHGAGDILLFCDF